MIKPYVEALTKLKFGIDKPKEWVGNQVETIRHYPFAHPCRRPKCNKKQINGRCSLDERDVDINGDCILFERRI
jgi:hypothetical protein